MYFYCLDKKIQEQILGKMWGEARFYCLFGYIVSYAAISLNVSKTKSMLVSTKQKH